MIVVWLARALILALTLTAGGGAAQSANPSGRTVLGRVALKAGSDPAFDLSRFRGFVNAPELKLRREVTVGADGLFRIAGLPAGKYDLSLDASGSPDPTTAGGALARIRRRFEVPDAGGSPVDLGALEVEVPRLLTERRRAPDFACVTYAGDEIFLKDYRGKFVLIEFWASWCGFCRAELPAMKQIHAEFGQDARFVMIGLSLDKNMAQYEAYVMKNGMPWIQGYLGDWSRDRTAPKYEVQEIPTMFLIGPDGRIITRHFTGKAMRESVARALAQGKPSTGSR